MIVIVEKVFSEDDEEVRFESCIQVKLENNKRIELYTQSDYDFRKHIGKSLECLISIMGPNKIDEIDPEKPSIEGVYKGEFIIPPKFFKKYKESDFEGCDAIESDIGTFIIGYLIAKENGLNEGDKFKLNVTRFGLWAWIPIEE